MISITKKVPKTPNLLNLMILTCFLTSTTLSIFTKQQENSRHQLIKKFILFTAEDGSTGKYWPGDATAVLGEEEYKKVIEINTKELNSKLAIQLKKHKNFLGSYFDKKTNHTFYVYGIMKNPIPKDEAPDADVLTEIAIKIDYGPGE